MFSKEILALFDSFEKTDNNDWSFKTSELKRFIYSFNLNSPIRMYLSTVLGIDWEQININNFEFRVDSDFIHRHTTEDFKSMYKNESKFGTYIMYTIIPNHSYAYYINIALKKYKDVIIPIIKTVDNGFSFYNTPLFKFTKKFNTTENNYRVYRHSLKFLKNNHDIKNIYNFMNNITEEYLEYQYNRFFTYSSIKEYTIDKEYTKDELIEKINNINNLFKQLKVIDKDILRIYEKHRKYYTTKLKTYDDLVAMAMDINHDRYLDPPTLYDGKSFNGSYERSRNGEEFITKLDLYLDTLLKFIYDFNLNHKLFINEESDLILSHFTNEFIITVTDKTNEKNNITADIYIHDPKLNTVIVRKNGNREEYKFDDIIENKEILTYFLYFLNKVEDNYKMFYKQYDEIYQNILECDTLLIIDNL